MTDSTTYRTNRDLFSNHYLNDHLRNTEPWTEPSKGEVESAYTEIKEILDNKRSRVEDYNEAQLDRNVIRPIFDILDISFEIEETVMRNARRPDYGFFPSEEAADTAFDRENFYEEAIAVADAKRWGRKLDTRGEEKRDFENPSYQIHRYLQETPAEWAVLTNGEKWRVYYGPTSHRLDSFYEIDLPALLDAVDEDGDLEAFKEFYLFFRQDAFLPDQSGDCFLDDVYDESSVFAEELGEDLQENIYKAIRVLAEGFLDTNDDLSEENLGLVHDSSLIYLYRLIFVLYAESEGRNLLPTDNEIYAESYSLNELKQTVVENRDETQKHYQTWQTNLWDRLDELFVLIDEGSQGQNIPKEDLYIPAYNGGLFRTQPDADDSVESQFLASHEAGDAYIAEVIELLTRHDASEGDGKVFVDYSSLDERNLGSIYEGLLEYKLDVAEEPLTVDDGEYAVAEEGDETTVEEGEVYLRTDDGERKATGSYYTPEYVVEYIVDETLGPLVEDIREDLLVESSGGFADEFADRVFDLTVLDPAMGSGHFPVNAVDYLAREIIDAQERQDRQALESEQGEVRSPRTEEGELRDINWARRKVAQRCIYGVDVNPLATELSKVSLWLRTLAAEQPLAFLDHHLKTGNSLVGSDIEDVLSDGDDDETEDGQLTLQQSFDHTRKRAMEHVTDHFQDLLTIDNETLEEAKEMEAVYDEVRKDPLYQNLLAMANVHTADAFGLDVPDDADERMARALHSEAWESIKEQDWFKTAQAMAEEERFFHWELEFPTAFYDQEGERREGAGFDAVIGNPPYAKIPAEMANRIAPDIANDLYAQFISLATEIVRDSGILSFITPISWETGPEYTGIRQLLFSEGSLHSILNLPYDVFEDAYVDTGVFVWQKGAGDGVCQTSDLSGTRTDPAIAIQNPEFEPISTHHWRELGFVALDKDWISMYERIGSNPTLGEVTNSTRGVLVTDESLESNNAKTDIFLGSYQRYERTSPDGTVKWDLLDEAPPSKDIFRGSRLLIRRLVSRSDRLLGTYNSEFFVSKKDVYIFKSEEFDERYLLALTNSRLLSWWHFNVEMSASKDDFRQVTLGGLRELPLPNVEPVTNGTDYSEIVSRYVVGDIGKSEIIRKISAAGSIKNDVQSLLVDCVEVILSKKERHGSLNLSLPDHLGAYDDSQTLSDIGFTQPPENAADSILQQTTEEKPNLRVGDAEIVRESPTTVEIRLSARYKPEDEDAYETDQWGYTETDPLPALRITDLTETEADLIEAFVPVAVDEAGGFADFRETATKTNSLVDRLRGLTLPRVADVAEGLASYIETKERADELDEKIQRTDDLIDEIVYELYGLTDEEIEIVEESVGT